MKELLRILVFVFVLLFILFGCDDSDPQLNQSTGKAGSMARFATTPGYVYTVDNQSLYVYQREPNGSLIKINERRLFTRVETIFYNEEKLFLGSQTAIFIFDVRNGANPVLLSEYNHLLSCDPVVVKDTLAFATFRLSDCRLQGIDVLEVINIKDLNNPVSLGMYALPTPYGLAVDGSTLYVCLGENGLRIFDVSNPRNLFIKSNHVGFHAFDVIVNNNVLIVTGNQGIRQYSYLNGSLNLISSLSSSL
ncbi:MAG: hypothetical protein O9340_14055 [Cyclobacteriaceae bacterium]|nr:hypothetical protein [Cyclobacteriaceae bacterium]